MDVRALFGLGDSPPSGRSPQSLWLEDNMQRMVLQVLLGISGLLMFVAIRCASFDFRSYRTGSPW
jgi:hypothetical protein